jgi:hypothetical protein
MKRVLFTALLLGATVGLGGCKFLKKKAPDDAPSAAPPTTAAPVAATSATPTPDVATPTAAAEPPLDENSVAAPQDFEDEAFEKVTQANFKAELSKLSKDINGK